MSSPSPSAGFSTRGYQSQTRKSAGGCDDSFCWLWPPFEEGFEMRQGSGSLLGLLHTSNCSWPASRSWGLRAFVFASGSNVCQHHGNVRRRPFPAAALPSALVPALTSVYEYLHNLSLSLALQAPQARLSTCLERRERQQDDDHFRIVEVCQVL